LWEDKKMHTTETVEKALRQLIEDFIQRGGRINKHSWGIETVRGEFKLRVKQTLSPRCLLGIVLYYSCFEEFDSVCFRKAAEKMGLAENLVYCLHEGFMVHADSLPSVLSPAEKEFYGLGLKLRKLYMKYETDG
jgi:hypothetical protein